MARSLPEPSRRPEPGCGPNVRFGVFLLAARYPGQGDAAALARTVEAAVAAERAGFDDVWLAEHHFMSSAHLAQVADTRAAAVDTLLREMPRWLGPGLEGYVPVDDRPRPRRDPLAYTRHLCDLHPVGSPDDCVEAIVTTVRRTGIRHLILLVEAAGSRAATLENIARLGAEVLPRARALLSAREGPARAGAGPGRRAPA
ncbi:MAG: LLM class flavin-dependent oxidoreductase, partial [Actinomadura rubrobrunea]|nr:LLM class flavin-dependent oxidoreductase [Actinomadura rubrobrunea]